MKVYFIGSHSVGKSTLSRYVSNNYKLPMISEAARMILSEQELQIDSLRCDLEVTDSYQKNVFNRQMLEEVKFNEFVSDRALIDILAYTAQHSRILDKLIKSQELEEYIQKLRHPDVKIFFVRPSKATMKDDGIRESLTWDGVVQIDAMVKFMLQMWNLNHFQISMDSMQERVKFIDSMINL